MIKLTKEYETGVDLIDGQHKELVDKLNKVASAGISSVTKDETEKTLGFLRDYIVKHFKDEENLQKQSGYPKHEWHKGQHELFFKEFQKLRHEYQTNGASVQYSFALNNSIIQWIMTHIKTVDVEFGKYYLANKKG